MSIRSPHADYVDRLADVLVAAVSDDSVGIPRFVRWLDRVDVDAEGSVQESIAAGIDACNRVFGAKPTREHRSGDGKLHETAQLVWANGGSALISAVPAGTGRSSHPEIMLLGSPGAVYFDGQLGGTATADELAGR